MKMKGINCDEVGEIGTPMIKKSVEGIGVAKSMVGQKAGE
jgi:hypothetical protein